MIRTKMIRKESLLISLFPLTGFHGFFFPLVFDF